MILLTEIWNILHDGTLAGIKGTVPGNVQLAIEIPYLRDFFSPPGKSFLIDLKDCSLLRMTIMTICNEHIVTEDTSKIINLKCIILSTDSLACPAKIITTEGELELSYSSVGLSLDTGEAITHQELDAACALYWKRFGEKIADSRQS